MTSCEYDWSEAAGCGTTLTLIPVSFENRFASAVSRLLPSPTESPTNVIFWPPYFFLIAAAFGTFGAAIAVECLAAVGRAFPTVAASEATSATAPINPNMARALRYFTYLRPFST